MCATWTDWISAISAGISAVAVLVGLIYAYRQLSTWKSEAIHRRRAEVAEDVLAAAHSAVDILNSLRSPMSMVPAEEVDNKTFVIEQKGKRLAEANSVFETLRHSQIRAKAVINNDDVDSAVDDLFSARRDFSLGLQILAEYAHDGRRELPDDEKAIFVGARRNVFGLTNDEDLLNVSMETALGTLNDHLQPIVQMTAINR